MDGCGMWIDDAKKRCFFLFRFVVCGTKWNGFFSFFLVVECYERCTKVKSWWVGWVSDLIIGDHCELSLMCTLYIDTVCFWKSGGFLLKLGY